MGAADKDESLVLWPLSHGPVKLSKGGLGFRAGGCSAAQGLAAWGAHQGRSHRGEGARRALTLPFLERQRPWGASLLYAVPHEGTEPGCEHTSCPYGKRRCSSSLKLASIPKGVQGPQQQSWVEKLGSQVKTPRVATHLPPCWLCSLLQSPLV